MLVGFVGRCARDESWVTSSFVGRDAAAELRAAWNADGRPDSAELLPSRVAAAAATVLGVAGTGLSLVQGRYRLPLGASDDTATAAERLQFTHGDGPCLAAARTGKPQVARMPDLVRRWPAFASDFAARTPYQAIISMPIAMDEATGALDIYLRDGAELDAVGLADAMAVAQEIGRALDAASASDGSLESADSDPDTLRPRWMGGATALTRGDVWIAVGMLMTPLGLPAPNILALLRSYAYGHDRTLDDLAGQLCRGDLDPADIIL
jgi:hypothetical protein